MASEDKFEETLNAELAKLQKDEQTQAGAAALLDKYRVAVRKIATSPARMGIRVQRLGAADDELLDQLRELSDTEHHDDGHEPPQSV